MAQGNPNPSPLTRWKPGQSGNPAGTHPWPPEYKSVRNLTKSEVAHIGSLILKHDMASLQALAVSPGSTVLQRMIARVAERIVNTGDMDALSRLLDRLIGPVRQEVGHHLIVGQQLIERVAGVLEANLQGHPELLAAIADQLAALLSPQDEQAPIDVQPEPQPADAA